MAYSTYFKNTALDAVITGVYVSAHTADPGITGASEVSGGSPAYARKAISFAAASSGSKAASSTPAIDVPAATTVTHLGFWDASTSGHFLAGANVDDETFNNQGTYTVNTATLDLNA
jgi:hypothetical protein